MAQAKTLSGDELDRVLTFIGMKKYAARNRCMILLTHYAGLRVGEVACLRWQDVVGADGSIKDEIRLLPDMTKGRHARTVFVSKKLREELLAGILTRMGCEMPEHPLTAELGLKLYKSGGGVLLGSADQFWSHRWTTANYANASLL